MHVLADSSADGDPAAAAMTDPRRPVALYAGPSAATRAEAIDGDRLPRARAGERLVGVLPPLYPEWLGDRGFARAHGARFPYVVGEMARGIATPRMVIDAVEAGLVAFFGSAGLPIAEIDAALATIASRLGPGRRGWGANLIHSPHEPEAEMAFARLALARGLPAVSASAFMRVEPAVVLLASRGLGRAPDGRIVRPRQVLAKVSRAEVARQLLSPAPDALLGPLCAQGLLSAAEADLARRVPIADDLTVEADSGGHTDNRPLTVLLPEALALARQIAAEHGYPEVPRVGAAGGLGTPAALAAAFAAGAAYVLTGSINQCTVQSGLSPDGRRMLARAEPADVAMAPAADMFELGVKVQVLKRGTLFAQRGARLYDAYRRYAGLDDLPADERDEIERTVLGRSVDEVWSDTRAHFAAAAPAEIERAERDPKHKMALCFRWYLFMGAHWARGGDQARRADYQIWCGPAMGAFNRWARGSFLEDPEGRDVVQVARNLLEGAAHVARAQALRQAGVALPPGAFDFRPRPLA
jgi:PfaD family protein